MRLLLDTHAFLWFVTDDPRLSSVARDLIEDGENELVLSAASHWEIAIKSSVRKLTLAEPFDVLIPREVGRHGIEILPIELHHSARVVALPFFHRDPFDRMIIAQALVEQIPLVSVDAAFDAYGVTRKW